MIFVIIRKTKCRELTEVRSNEFRALFISDYSKKWIIVLVIASWSSKITGFIFRITDKCEYWLRGEFLVIVSITWPGSRNATDGLRWDVCHTIVIIISLLATNNKKCVFYEKWLFVNLGNICIATLMVCYLPFSLFILSCFNRV